MIRYDDGSARVYGWIDRDDGRSDFLVVDLDAAGGATDFTTSSTAWSAKLCAHWGWDHAACISAADVFAAYPQQ